MRFTDGDHYACPAAPWWPKVMVADVDVFLAICGMGSVVWKFARPVSRVVCAAEQ